MKRIGRHDTQARRLRLLRRNAMVLAIAVALLAVAWLSFNVLIRLITLD